MAVYSSTADTDAASDALPSRRSRVLASVLGPLVGFGVVGQQRRVRAVRADAGTKVAMITGASSGIGKAAALELARSGIFSTVVLAGRNSEKHAQAVQDIQSAAGSGPVADLKYIPLDLSSLASVRSCVSTFQELKLPLHALVNNGGVMALPDRQVTVDGYEYQFQVDYLSHFLLTGLLLPRLEASGTPNDPSRVLSVSSSAHFVRSPLALGDTSDLNSSGADDSHQYFPWTAYGQAKLAQVEHTYELARRLKDKYGEASPVVAHVLHPGIVDTDIGRYLAQGLKMPKLPFVKSPTDGAKAVVYLATSTDAAVVKESGKYWGEEAKEALSLGRGANPAPWSNQMAVAGTDSYDQAAWARLWSASEQLVAAKVVV